MVRLSAVALVLGLLLALVGAVEADAKSRTIRCDKGADLQRAIDRSDSGDRLAIKGVCRGNFVVDGKQLTLKGRGWVDGSLLVTGAKGRATLRDLGVAGGGYAAEEEPEAIVPTREVVIATRSISAGDPIEPMVLSMRVVPRDETTAMALMDPILAHGTIAAIDILPNQIIMPNFLRVATVHADPTEGSESPTPSPDQQSEG